MSEMQENSLDSSNLCDVKHIDDEGEKSTVTFARKSLSKIGRFGMESGPPEAKEYR